MMTPPPCLGPIVASLLLGSAIQSAAAAENLPREGNKERYETESGQPHKR